MELTTEDRDTLDNFVKTSGLGANFSLSGTAMKKFHFSVLSSLILLLTLVACSAKTTVVMPASASDNMVRIIYLHHSTGDVIWKGGIPEKLASYNSRHATNYSIAKQAYPNKPYPWSNYPYDYWYLWVAHKGESMGRNQVNLDMLVRDYDVIVFKHCFPVSNIEHDAGPASISSFTKSLQNYYLQYDALKARLREFPNKRFIVWTGAALRMEQTTPENATRAKTFFDWVRNTWDEKGDNIFVWDFYALETEGGLYLTPGNATKDSHPNQAFAYRVAPLFVNRLVDVIEGRGDTGSITGK